MVPCAEDVPSVAQVIPAYSNAKRVMKVDPVTVAAVIVKVPVGFSATAQNSAACTPPVAKRLAIWVYEFPWLSVMVPTWFPPPAALTATTMAWPEAGRALKLIACVATSVVVKIVTF